MALYNPLSDNWGELVLVQGHEMPKPGDNAGASWDRVSASYLQDFGISVLRGRGFTDKDDERSELVAVVNEGFVKRFFKSSEDPLGQHFGLDEPRNVGTFRIVGVVRDAKFAGWGLSRPAMPMFYVPLSQNVDYGPTSVMARVERQSHFVGGLMLETTQAPGGLEPQLTRALAEVDPNLTIVSVKTMREQVESRFDQERAVASLAGLFGVVALLLAAVGLYGVTAYSVAQRTNEIGIRMALGADRTRVIDLVLRSAFARVAIGLIAGVPLAVTAGRLISTQLYGVKFWDPIALSAAAGALAIAAFCAAMIPALRAAGLSPIKALRTE
jgi:predicted permease